MVLCLKARESRTSPGLPRAVNFRFAPHRASRCYLSALARVRMQKGLPEPSSRFFPSITSWFIQSSMRYRASPQWDRATMSAKPPPVHSAAAFLCALTRLSRLQALRHQDAAAIVAPQQARQGRRWWHEQAHCVESGRGPRRRRAAGHGGGARGRDRRAGRAFRAPPSPIFWATRWPGIRACWHFSTPT